MLRSSIVLTAVIAAASLLAGCGAGDVAGLSVAAPANAAMTAEIPAEGGKSFSSPFSDSAAQPLGGREVMKNPTIADVMAPSSSLPEMTLGRADAPVTIIKYASMTCPYCARFQKEVFPELKRQYIDTGKVRFIIREFPIGFQSGAATIALRCADPAKQFALYDKLMAQQASWVSMEVRSEPIFKVASQIGMTRARFDECRTDKAMIGELNKVKERGRSLGVIGTPNFFINGRLIKSVLTLADVKAIIDPIIAGGGASAEAPVAQKS